MISQMRSLDKFGYWRWISSNFSSWDSVAQDPRGPSVKKSVKTSIGFSQSKGPFWYMWKMSLSIVILYSKLTFSNSPLDRSKYDLTPYRNINTRLPWIYTSMSQRDWNVEIYNATNSTSLDNLCIGRGSICVSWCHSTSLWCFIDGDITNKWPFGECASCRWRHDWYLNGLAPMG